MTTCKKQPENDVLLLLFIVMAAIMELGSNVLPEHSATTERSQRIPFAGNIEARQLI